MMKNRKLRIFRMRQFFPVCFLFLFAISSTVLILVLLDTKFSINVGSESWKIEQSNPMPSYIQPNDQDTFQDSCNLDIDWNKTELVTRTGTTDGDNNDWTFTRKVSCPKIPLMNVSIPRKKVTLNCKLGRPFIKISETIQPHDIFQISYDDPCLTNYIDNCCSDGKPVPNIVHFIWFMYKEFNFFHYLSFMSAVRFVRPCLILLHGNYVPHGRYWRRFTLSFPYVILVQRSAKSSIFGNKIMFLEQISDVMRIEILKDYGGIYLDYDEVVLRPLEPLRIYDYVQGLEFPNQLGSQLIMAKKNATFLQLWYDSYKYYSEDPLYNAQEVPATLAKRYPELIHVEGYNFTRPNWKSTELIFNHNYNWSTNYAMHSYARMLMTKYPDRNFNLTNIRYLNTTIGSISRHVLLGNKELCED